jgi:hypothetical protein
LAAEVNVCNGFFGWSTIVVSASVEERGAILYRRGLPGCLPASGPADMAN